MQNILLYFFLFPSFLYYSSHSYYFLHFYLFSSQPATARNDNLTLIPSGTGQVVVNGNISATNIAGTLSKTGGSFTIRHPDPAKSGSMALQHSFVESPTAGDNLYTFVVSASADNQTVVTNLPSYWEFLNGTRKKV